MLSSTCKQSNKMPLAVALGDIDKPLLRDLVVRQQTAEVAVYGISRNTGVVVHFSTSNGFSQFLKRA